MATVIYNGASIIPAPLVTFTDEPIIAGNQKRIGNTYKVQINGTLVSYKGSPASAPYGGGTASASWGAYNNQFWVNAGYPPDEVWNSASGLHQLYAVESKQEALRSLFATEGQWLEFGSQDGSLPLKCQPKNISITFDEGVWFTECKYQVTCETDVLYLNGQIYQGLPYSGLIQQANESWDISPNSQFTKNFDMSHTVSAVGKRTFDSLGNETKPAWQIAQDFVYQQLSLGWNSISNFSPQSGNYIFNNSSLASGTLNFAGYTPYNYSRLENVDELAGSYQVTERWDVALTSSGTNIYTVNTRRIVDDPYTTVVTQIQGTVYGRYDGLFNYDQRLAAAEYTWSQIAGPTGLLNLINSTYSGYNYNVQPRQGELDYNINEGTLTYNYEFSNTLYEQDAFDQWTISKKVSADSYLTTYAIAGTVKGRRYDGDTDVKASFNRAYAWFSTISGSNYATLYNRILSSTYYPEASGMGVQPDPVSRSIDINEGEGVISYSLEYNNRANDSIYPADSATDEYQISKHFDRNEGITHYTINGSVKGLNITDYANARKSKFDNASGYFYTYVIPNLYSRVQSYYNVSLPDTTPMSTEIGMSIGEGAINYTFEFTNLFPPILPGALSEKIDIVDNNYNTQVQVMAQINVPGRPSGPVLQDVQTSIVKTRTIAIETVMGPTGDLGGNLVNAYGTKPSYDSYVYQIAPANGRCQSWQSNWDWRYGRFTLTAEFIYE